VNVVETSWIEI